MSKKKKEDAPEPTFEALIAETENAVNLLESGELSLEEAMAKYELGVKNLTACSGIITEAQKQVEQLITDREGKLKLEPFDEEA